MADLGQHFGGHLYEIEVRYLVRDEWAVEAEDVLWRRTKEGLHMTQAEREQLRALACRTSAKLCLQWQTPQSRRPSALPNDHALPSALKRLVHEH